MRKFSLVIVLILIAQFVSCQKSAEANLYVIDSLKLGSTTRQFEGDLLKFNLSKKTFYTTDCFINEKHIADNTIRVNTSNIFNFDDSKLQTHIGLILPDFGNLNNRLIGVLVLLGHTKNAKSCIDYSSVSDVTNIETFDYKVRRDYIEKIEMDLIKKYGNPKRNTSLGTLFHGFVGKEVQTFMTTEEYNGEILEWNNNNIRILFYKGSPNDATYFLPSIQKYKQTSNMAEYNEDKNDAIYTYNNPFISYYLQEDYISKMKFEEPNL